MSNAEDFPTPGALARQWFTEVWIQRDSSAIHRLAVPYVRGHMEGGVEISSPAEFEAFHRSLLAAFPDLETEILSVLEDETLACVRWKSSGTHLGDELGVKASNKAVVIQGSTWLLVKDGQIVEGWDYWNQGQLFAQLTA